MKTIVWVLAMAAMGAGCAHGWGEARAHSIRGMTKVGSGPRLLVGGPALSVHTSIDDREPVTLFVVERVNGDDSDCTRDPARALTLAEDARHHVDVAAGRALCAVAASGTREVLWHARAEEEPSSLWAHK